MARKCKQDYPLAALMKTATKEKLVDLLVLVASSRPAVRHECINYLTRYTALSHNQKKQSEGEKLLALWAELAPDLDELDAYGGGDYDADFQVSSLLQEITQTLSRKQIEAAYRQQLLDNVLPYIESGNAGLDDDLYMWPMRPVTPTTIGWHWRKLSRPWVGTGNSTMPAAFIADSATGKNTIDDADYIINWIVLIFIFQCVTNSGHSHSIVAGGLLEMS